MPAGLGARELVIYESPYRKFLSFANYKWALRQRLRQWLKGITKGSSQWSQVANLSTHHELLASGGKALSTKGKERTCTKELSG